MVLKKIKKSQTIKKGLEFLGFASSLPSAILNEAIAFAKRNSIGVIKDKDKIEQICPRCLKAHLVKKASEGDQDKAVVEILKNMPQYELGHNGYYMDKGKIFKN